MKTEALKTPIGMLTDQDIAIEGVALRDARVKSADHDLPCDFLRHLQQELGTTEDAAVSLLGEWLEKYEPAEASRRPRGPGLSGGALGLGM